ncbi:GroES-like protein [Abortiporus biennis]|nr:GroES-like protein [Abortiporus biennis]
MTLPSSYKAVAFKEKNGKLEPLEVAWKDPAPNEVVVKVLACGICAGDEIVEHQGFPTGLPRIPGHEVVGDVVAVPPTEKTFKVGDRVGAGWHGGHCFTCIHCRSGDFVACTSADIVGIKRDGGFAEYVHIRSEALVNVPKDLDPTEAAPLLCAGVTTFNSLRNMSLKHGELVAVQGIGGLGHLGIQFAKKMGYRVVALSSGPSKKELSLQLGASDYLDSSQVDQATELQKLGGAKVIMCCAPNAQQLRSLIGGLTIGGTLLVLGVPHEEFSVPAFLLVSKRLSIRGWPSGSPVDSEECLQFAKETGVTCMVNKFPLDKAQEAYDHRSSARFRAVITP